MMPVVVFLQFVEVAVSVLGCVDVVQGIVANIVGHVPDEEEAPEEGWYDGIAERNHLCHCFQADKKSANSQEGRVDQSVPE